MSAAGQDFARTRDLPRLDALASALGTTLGAEQREQLTRYVELVLAWNKKLDLTAARGADNQLEVLLADALVLARTEIIPHGADCLDVGSGAGAPIIPLLLVRNDLRAELREPLHKRVAFLRSALGTLGLVARAKVHQTKLDPVQPARREPDYDIALSRATFAPQLWIGAATQLATRSLALLADQPPPAAPASARLSATHEYRLPFSDAPRRIAIYDRTGT
jgi:16S rRNA (guanine527-N7)-methyltransferase